MRPSGFPCLFEPEYRAWEARVLSCTKRTRLDYGRTAQHI